MQVVVPSCLPKALRFRSIGGRMAFLVRQDKDNNVADKW